jgi:hypothetical protein
LRKGPHLSVLFPSAVLALGFRKKAKQPPLSLTNWLLGHEGLGLAAKTAPWSMFVKREALLFEYLNGRVKCCTCERRCELLPDRLGFCKTRKNVGGKLYTLVYGEISSISANPIEKKPLFHFYPG